MLCTATPDISRSSENVNNTARVSRLSFRFLWLWWFLSIFLEPPSTRMCLMSASENISFRLFVDFNNCTQLQVLCKLNKKVYIETKIVWDTIVATQQRSIESFQHQYADSEQSISALRDCAIIHFDISFTDTLKFKYLKRFWQTNKSWKT